MQRGYWDGKWAENSLYNHEGAYLISTNVVKRLPLTLDVKPIPYTLSPKSSGKVSSFLSVDALFIYW